MKLVINRPEPMVDPNTPVFVSASGSSMVTGNPVIWDDAVKTNRLDDGNGNYSINAGDIPAGGKAVYIELQYRSLSLRDYSISAQYNLVGYDSVAATAIYASAGTPTYSQGLNIAQTFPDMDQDLQDFISFMGGTGLVGPFTANSGKGVGIGQGAVIQYTVQPLRGPNDGTWQGDGVLFDATQQLSQRMWTQQNQGDQFIVPPGNATIPFPTRVEYANDDSIEGDEIAESKVVTPEGHFYFYDRPGFKDPMASQNDIIIRQDFRNFLRVAFKPDQFGDGEHGSRVSLYRLWHANIELVPDWQNGGLWKTNPAGTDIGQGNPDLTVPDPNA